MDTESICPHCFHTVQLGDMMMIYDVTCSQCFKHFCGQCLQESHFPAYCTDSWRWEAPLERMDAIVLHRVQACQTHWNQLDELIGYVSHLEQQAKDFAHIDPLFRERLQFPSFVIQLAAHFLKWVCVHGIYRVFLFNCLEQRLETLFYRIQFAVAHLPILSMADDVWMIFSYRLRLRLMHLLGLLVDINEILPFARNIVVPGFAPLITVRTYDELELDAHALDVQLRWLNALWGIAAVMLP